MNITATDQRLADLLIGAFEGGSNYWYVLHNENDDTSVPYWERVFIGHGLRVSNGKIENVPGRAGYKLVSVNRDRMLKALQIMHDKYPKHYADFIKEQDDATTADIFLQLCVLGEVLYG